MAVFIADQDIWRTTLVVTHTDQTSITDLHYRAGNIVTGGITDAEWLTIFNGVVIPLLLPVLCNSANYIGTYCQRLFPLPILPRAIDKSAAAVGTAGATPLPPQTAGLTTWYTAKAGRAQIGRTYWPFPATAMSTTTGQPAGGTVTNYIALAAGVRAGVTPAVGFSGSCDMLLSILHRNTSLTDQIQTSLSHQSWATQKRRGAFGKPNTSPI